MQRWETALFGGQISMEWWKAAPSRFWSTLLHAAYFSYYLIVTVPALIFLKQGRLQEARHFVFAVMATFVTCYLVFLFFPVAGPYYQFPHPAAWFIDNPPARLVYATLAVGSSYGAAFPSSHVAAAVAATVAAFRGSRKVGLALVIPTLLLTVGVVYCQMHYGVDAVAGRWWGWPSGGDGERGTGNGTENGERGTEKGERGTGINERKRNGGRHHSLASRSLFPVPCSPLYCTVIFPCIPSARCGRQ